MNKKVVFLVFLTNIVLVGCTNNNKENSVNNSVSSEKSTTASSSDQEYVTFQVFRPTYSLDDNNLTISGTATSGSKVVVFDNEKELTSVDSISGKFTIRIPLPVSDEDEVTYTVRKGSAAEVIPVKTKSYLEALAKKKNDDTSSTSNNSSYDSNSSENGTRHHFSDYDEHKIGDKLRFETGHEIQVLDISVSKEEPNSYYLENDHFIEVTFTFMNGEKEAITLGAPNFSLLNNDGTEARRDSKNFLYEVVEPGETIQHTMYFDAKKGPYRFLAGNSAWLS